MASNLAEKYAQERLKRLRSDGNGQYVNTRSTEINDLSADPWADYEALAAQPQPLKDGGSVRFLIVGGGHQGICYAARLVEAGFDPSEVVVTDVAGGVGGTWYWNRYPGLMCDVEGYCYLPFLEETDYAPKHKYSFGAEIRGQSERVVAKYKFGTMLCTQINRQVWREDRGRWEVTMTQSLGHVRKPTQLTVDVQFLIVTGGVLSLQKVPRAPGFPEFRARHDIFHTARWNYAITGGSQEAPDMEKLRDKRVAIIGTGATGVQAIPHLAKWAKHLYVIQRTPSYCGPRGQKETTPEDWAKITESGKGWQERRRMNLDSHLTGNPEPVDLVDDGWSHNGGRAGLIGGSGWKVTPETVPQHVEKLLSIDTPHAEKLRARIDEIVKDPKVAEKLKPWYPGWCKRPTFNDDYLPTFNRDNVTLVDTDGQGIKEYTERGIVVAGGDHAGVELDIDVLVLATGFTVGGTLSPEERVEAPIIGTGGKSLGKVWDAPDSKEPEGERFSTLFGLARPGFPNLFFSHSVGSTASYNLTSPYDQSAKILARVMRTAIDQAGEQAAQKLVIEANRAAADKWTDLIAGTTAWYAALLTCTPSYFNDEGAAAIAPTPSPEEQAAKARRGAHGEGVNEFKRITNEYMDKLPQKGPEGWDIRELEVKA